MIFQDSEIEMRGRVRVLEIAVNNADGHGFPPEYAKVLRDIVFRAHLDVFRGAFLGDPPARAGPMTVRLQPGARVVRANSQPEGNCLS